MSSSNQTPRPSAATPRADRPDVRDLTEMGLWREQVRNGWAMLDLMQDWFDRPTSPSQALDPDLAAETPATRPDAPTTPQPLDQTGSVPEQLKSVQGDSEFEQLANGQKASRYLIEALNDMDRVWPGASLHHARPAIVAYIESAQRAKATTLYPFCMNDDPNVPTKESPCILKKGHRGRHKDNDDGSWP